MGNGLVPKGNSLLLAMLAPVLGWLMSSAQTRRVSKNLAAMGEKPDGPPAAAPLPADDQPLSQAAYSKGLVWFVSSYQ